jgi:hypothetical protein
MRHSEIGAAGRAKHWPAAFSDVADDMLTARKAGKFNLIVHAARALAMQYEELSGIGKWKRN